MQYRSIALFTVVAISACATPRDGAESSSVPSDDEPKPSVGRPAQPSPEPEGLTGIVIDSPDECVEKTASRTTVSKLDPVRRLIVVYVGGKMERAARFDADKKVLAGAYWGEGTVVQHDYTYDANDHVAEYRMSYVAWAPFFTPANTPTHQSLQYMNTYGENHTLVRSFRTQGGQLSEPPSTNEYLFEDNDAGQCARLETRTALPNGVTNVMVETRRYDEAGRLWRSDVIYDPPASVAEQGVTPMSTTIWTYNVQGRLEQTRWWHDGTKLDDPPDATTTIAHGADGSQRIESINKTSDSGDFGPFVTERSAYCAVIDAWASSDAKGKPKLPRCTTQ